jgi:hypothetical protein
MRIFFRISCFIIILFFSNSCKKNEVSDSVIIGSIEIKKTDLPNKLNWNDAISTAASLGGGWRLPTRVELEIMYSNRNTIGGFDLSSGEYWSSEAFSTTQAYIATYGTFGIVPLNKSSLSRVRLVK